MVSAAESESRLRVKNNTEFSSSVLACRCRIALELGDFILAHFYPDRLLEASVEFRK
jgi:hypothetical protein